MPRYNNDGRSAKFLLDTRSGFQMDRMKGSRRKDMKLKLDTDVRMGDDEEMGSSSQGHHQRHGGGKKFQQGHHQGGRGKGRGKWNKRQQHHQPQRQQGGRERGHEYGPGWHKCTIFDGASMNRDNILQIFANAVGSRNVRFQPICYTLNPPNSVFYIETRAAAEALGSQTFESVKFRICHSAPPPTAAFIPSLEEKLIFELKSRLSTMGHLNLSNFHNTVAMGVDHYLPLCRNSVGAVVGKIINEWIGCVTSVDVSFNKLLNMESIAFLSHATNLKCLIANDNKLRDVNSLDHFKSESVVEVNLLNNPVSASYKSRNKYESELKKKFPSLLKLDNKEIDASALINFDIDKYTVPTAKRSWFCNESAQNVVKTFVTEYIRLYDSSRDDLANAYSEQAVLTLSSSYMQDKSSSSLNIPHHLAPHTRLSEYIGESRNIMLGKKENRKSRRVHVGREEIVRFLKKLPATKHLDYVIDMPVALEAFIVFTMQGLFKEPLEKNTIRHFMRSFTLVPCNNGFVIVNEMLFITNPTPAQYKSATTAPKSDFASAPQPVVSMPPPTMPVADAFKPPETMEEKLKLFMEKSLMNLEWARKCLEENAWDFDRSIFIFSELSKVGKIPPEAFQPARI